MCGGFWPYRLKKKDLYPLTRRTFGMPRVYTIGLGMGIPSSRRFQYLREGIEEMTIGARRGEHGYPPEGVETFGREEVRT
jgi:hypothetical protein